MYTYLQATEMDCPPGEAGETLYFDNDSHSCLPVSTTCS